MVDGAVAGTAHGGPGGERAGAPGGDGVAAGAGLGWTSLCRGGASIRGRVRRTAPCARPVGPALDSRDPVLVKNRPELLTRGAQV